MKAAQKEGVPRIQWRRERRKSARAYQKCPCCATSPQLDFVGNHHMSPESGYRFARKDMPPPTDAV